VVVLGCEIYRLRHDARVVKVSTERKLESRPPTFPRSVPSTGSPRIRSERRHFIFNPRESSSECERRLLLSTCHEYRCHYHRYYHRCAFIIALLCIYYRQLGEIICCPPVVTLFISQRARARTRLPDVIADTSRQTIDTSIPRSISGIVDPRRCVVVHIAPSHRLIARCERRPRKRLGVLKALATIWTISLWISSGSRKAVGACSVSCYTSLEDFSAHVVLPGGQRERAGGEVVEGERGEGVEGGREEEEVEEKAQVISATVWNIVIVCSTVQPLNTVRYIPC